MKERPILFSGPMVRAILEGRKTQTRRVMKEAIYSQPVLCENVTNGGRPTWVSKTPLGSLFQLCPYGEPGDRLWVRETFHEDWERNRTFYRADADENGEVPYLIEGDRGGVASARIDKWTPSLFMRRRHCRIVLEVVSVRVERLQDISAADAMAEGIDLSYIEWAESVAPPGSMMPTPQSEYMNLWERINGRGSWNANPWVWVVEFRPLAQAGVEAAKPVPANEVSRTEPSQHAVGKADAPNN